MKLINAAREVSRAVSSDTDKTGCTGLPSPPTAITLAKTKATRSPRERGGTSKARTPLPRVLPGDHFQPWPRELGPSAAPLSSSPQGRSQPLGPLKLLQKSRRLKTEHKVAKLKCEFYLAFVSFVKNNKIEQRLSGWIKRRERTHTNILETQKRKSPSSLMGELR